MNKIDIPGLINQAKVLFKRKSPEILTGLGIAGMTMSVILAIKATPGAIERIEEQKKKEHHRNLTTTQTIKTAGSCYIPTVITWAVSTGCLIGASVVNERRNAALMAAYSLAETNLKDLTAKTRELLSEKKAEEIFEAADQAKMERNPMPIQDGDDESIERGNGERLIRICDPFGRYFYSNRAIIDRAVNKLNRQMSTMFEPYVSLNEFLREIEAQPLEDVGDKIGWNLNRGLIEIRYSSKWINDQTVRGCIAFEVPPEYGYDTP